MNGDTTVISREGAPTNGSSIFGVSIRAWVVIIITSSVVSNWVLNSVLASLGYTSYNFTVPEPIYTVFIAVISYYFGTIKK